MSIKERVFDILCEQVKNDKTFHARGNLNDIEVRLGIPKTQIMQIITELRDERKLSAFYPESGGSYSVIVHKQE